MAKTKKELRAIFSKKTKSGLTIKILKGDNIQFHEDFFKVVGDDSPQFTQSKERAFEIANAKVRVQNKRFERLKEMKS